MSHPHHMIDLAHVKHFVFAGNATFTLLSKKTGTRFTYKCAIGRDDKNASFIRLRTGSDHWTFVGVIQERTRYVHATRKSRIIQSAESIVALKWFIYQISNDRLPNDKLEVWHEGRCGKCGRELTVPSSIAAGIGPICARGGIDPDGLQAATLDFFKPLEEQHGRQSQNH